MAQKYKGLIQPIMVIATIICCITATNVSLSAQTCPLSDGTTDTAKSHKLFLYFPAADDPTFPNYGVNVSPARAFDVATLSPGIGTTAALIDRIHDVVDDDYCEFNVQVLATTTNPATLPMPPAQRVTVAIGSDDTGAWGQAQEVDIGNGIDIDFARVWAGTYTTCEGGTGAPGNCSMTGALTGANATLDRWAQAIGGTAAHEAGHTYGLAHTDDDPPDDAGGQPGPPPLPGEDSFHRHLMPAGYNLTGEDRAGFRRHFSDRTYSLLAANVGLSIETMHNWDFQNPNAEEAHSLAIDFLSTLPTVTISWTYMGSLSPWINPVVTGPLGTSVFRGTTYNRYRITWSVGNPAWLTAAPGVLPGGAECHIGATFTGVDFNQPDPIIIQNVTLFDAGSNPLTLHPRLPMYDAGTIDSANDTFAVQFFAPPGGMPLIRTSAIIHQLPRVAAIESMTGDGRPMTRSGLPIGPWSVSTCPPAVLLDGDFDREDEDSNRDTHKIHTDREDGARCIIASLSAPPHVEVIHRVGEENVYDCSQGVPRIKPPITTQPQDSPFAPDFEGPICAGVQRDLFPSTTVYIIATFVDPIARHFDPKRERYVVGPVTSKVFYQFSGIRNLPDREDGD
jgi:hypothetical protein